MPFLGPFLFFLMVWLYGRYMAAKAYKGEDVKMLALVGYAAKYADCTLNAPLIGRFKKRKRRVIHGNLRSMVSSRLEDKILLCFQIKQAVR